MAKQIFDKKTMELIGLPGKKGRPPTGNAMSSAERVRQYRLRQKEAKIVTVTLENKEAELTAKAIESFLNKSDCLPIWQTELKTVLKKLKKN